MNKRTASPELTDAPAPSLATPAALTSTDLRAALTLMGRATCQVTEAPAVTNLAARIEQQIAYLQAQGL